jgi:hypothetical protein
MGLGQRLTVQNQSLIAMRLLIRQLTGGLLAVGGRFWRGLSGLLGYTAPLNCARSPLAVALIPHAVSLFRARTAIIIWYPACQLCYLGFGWRRQLCSAQNPGLSELSALGWAGESLYAEVVPLVLRPFFASDTRSPAHHHERAPFGVCGLLAMPTSPSDLWGRSCWLSALAR